MLAILRCKLELFTGIQHNVEANELDEKNNNGETSFKVKVKTKEEVLQSLILTIFSKRLSRTSNTVVH